MSPSCGAGPPSPGASSACITAPAASSCSSLPCTRGGKQHAFAVRVCVMWLSASARTRSCLGRAAPCAAQLSQRMAARRSPKWRCGINAPVIMHMRACRRVAARAPNFLVLLLALRLELGLDGRLLWRRAQLLQIALQVSHGWRGRALPLGVCGVAVAGQRGTAAGRAAASACGAEQRAAVRVRARTARFAAARLTAAATPRQCNGSTLTSCVAWRGPGAAAGRLPRRDFRLDDL